MLIQVGVKIQNVVPPSSVTMLWVGAIALAANLVWLALLWRFRKPDLNMSSTFECSRHDVVANCGVLFAAVGVALLNSPWPDIVIGLIIAGLFLRTAYRVLSMAWPAFRAGNGGGWWQCHWIRIKTVNASPSNYGSTIVGRPVL